MLIAMLFTLLEVQDTMQLLSHYTTVGECAVLPLLLASSSINLTDQQRLFRQNGEVNNM